MSKCLQVESENCARIADDSRIDLVSCDSLLANHRPGGRSQTFELTSDGRLVTSGDCLTVTSSYYVIRQKCNSNGTEYQVDDLCRQSINSLTSRLLHCVSKKRHPFYICHNLIRCHPILLILGRNILQEIWNKHKCTENHISFRAFVLYRVKSSNDFYGIQLAYSIKYEVST